MKIKVITLFPNCFPGVLSIGLIGKALEKKIFTLEIIDLKEYSINNRIDDRPIGGNEGMVISPLILEKVLVKNTIFMSPRGRVLNQKILEEYSKLKEITILCGRYEGIDERVIKYYDMDEISIGDFILCGGEVASQLFIEGIVRLLPNVIKNENSIINESFINNLLEHDYFTKPNNWKGIEVPEILFSGNHKKINEWKFINSCNKTINKRQDLWNKFLLDISFIYLIKIIYKIFKI